MPEINPQEPLSSESRLITAVHEITRELSSTLDLDEGLRRTLEVAMQAVDATGGAIWLHDPKNRQLVCRHAVGGKAEALRNFVMADNKGNAGQVYQTGQPELVNDAASDPHHARDIDEWLKYQTRNLVTSPIRYAGGQIIGVIQLINKRSGDFIPEDLLVLNIVGSVAAMSIQKMDLAQEAKKVAALHYVGHFAHDIKNDAMAVVGGVPTLELLLEDLRQRCNAPANASLIANIQDIVHDMDIYGHKIRRTTEFLADSIKGRPIKLEIAPNDLTQVADGILKKFISAAGRAEVRLEGQFDGPVICPFDSLLIESAIYNLINNALPETPRGGTVRVRVWQADGEAVVEVADTGRGMPPYILQSILSGEAISTKPGGTGLGTAIVKRVAELHHGRFEGESTEGVGTTFRIRLPLQQPGETPTPG
ncbi:MAG TPA: GAF domain-containing sensor histidine kinase [Chthonomonadaceae bacterium]|nr:GAF domain-containing sensor histidine kinase [Chthonomonadaceae bacterium]